MNLLINFFHTPEILYLLHLTFFLLVCHFFRPMLSSFVSMSFIIPHTENESKALLVFLPCFKNFSFLSVLSILPYSLRVLSVFPLKWWNNLLVLI